MDQNIKKKLDVLTTYAGLQALWARLTLGCKPFGLDLRWVASPLG